MHLTPFQVVTAINHAQLRLGRDFKQEEFDSGDVGQLMIDEDFDFEKAVSLYYFTNSSLLVFSACSLTNPSLYSSLLIFHASLLQKEALSSDHRKQFQDELNTLSGALKAKYDEINKEYQGIHLLLDL